MEAVFSFQDFLKNLDMAIEFFYRNISVFMSTTLSPERYIITSGRAHADRQRLRSADTSLIAGQHLMTCKDNLQSGVTAADLLW